MTVVLAATIVSPRSRYSSIDLVATAVPWRQLPRSGEALEAYRLEVCCYSGPVAWLEAVVDPPHHRRDFVPVVAAPPESRNKGLRGTYRHHPSVLSFPDQVGA
jgi:hypothetical protein